MQTAQELAYLLWALTHGLVTLELSHNSRSPLAHPALARTNGQDVLDTGLRTAISGWTRTRRTDRRNRLTPNRIAPVAARTARIARITTLDRSELRVRPRIVDRAHTDDALPHVWLDARSQ